MKSELVVPKDLALCSACAPLLAHVTVVTLGNGDLNGLCVPCIVLLGNANDVSFEFADIEVSSAQPAMFGKTVTLSPPQHALMGDSPVIHLVLG